MSIEELRVLKEERFTLASNNGVFAGLATIARELGEPVNDRFRPKYRWSSADDFAIEIYVDDYGGYMTVKMQGTPVASTHRTEQFIIPGPWVSAVLVHLPEADRRSEVRKESTQQAERESLLAKVVVMPGGE
jgi:hypothetical protein